MSMTVMPVFRRLNNQLTMCDFRLLPQCGRELHSSGLLHTGQCNFLTDVLGQPNDPIYRGQDTSAVQFSYLSIYLPTHQPNSMQHSP